MALNRDDVQVRIAIRGLLARILGYVPTDEQVNRFIAAYNSRPIDETRQQKVASSVAVNFSLTLPQKVAAASGDIDRIITEIEAQKKGK